MSFNLQAIEKEVELYLANAALTYVTANAARLEAELQPIVAAGETSVEALAAKVSPVLAAVVAAAVAALGTSLPQYEGDAVAWITATLKAFVASLG